MGNIKCDKQKNDKSGTGETLFHTTVHIYCYTVCACSGRQEEKEKKNLLLHFILHLI